MNATKNENYSPEQISDAEKILEVYAKLPMRGNAQCPAYGLKTFQFLLHRAVCNCAFLGVWALGFIRFRSKRL